MSFSLWCSSSLEAKNPHLEGFCSNRTKVPLPKASVLPVKKDEFHNCSYDAQRAVVASSSHLAAKKLQEVSKSKKKWGEMNANRNLECVRTLLIDNYDSYTFNIYQELSVINKGTFKLTLQFTEDYPNKPPTVRFVSRMFHPDRKC